MTEFDAKWRACAAASAAAGATAGDDAAPFGFAGRVLASAAARRVEAAALELAFQRFTVRLMGLVGVFLVFCAVIELPHLRDRRPLDPGLEDTVAQLVWNL